MRKIYLLLVALLFAVTGMMAQFAVTTNGGSGLAATYPDLASAITALNGATITSPVIITCAAGAETNPAGGYSITATGTATNTILIEGAGPTSVITAPTPAGTAGNLNDAIFKIIGGDYITIQNFSMNENAANTTTAAGTNNMVEWGVALLYAAATNGAQNCIIQNNTITLNRTYQNTFGIYSNSTHTAAAVTTSVTATGASGGNSGLKIYGNTVSNVNNGIVVVGPTGAADYNIGIDIGGTGGAQANSITNYGTTGTFSAFANVSTTVNGIIIRNSIGYNVSFNTVTSSVGGVTAGTLNGIQAPSFSSVATGTYTTNINNNIISLKSGLASGAMNGINVITNGGTATSTLNINNNTFTDWGHTVAASGTIIFINNTNVNQVSNINSNRFNNLNVNTTGSVTFISQNNTAAANATKNVNNNSILTGFTKTGAGGTVTFAVDNGSTVAGAVSNYQNNSIINGTLTGTTAFLGISCTDGGTSPSKNITNNTIDNWTSGASSITGINVTYLSGVSSISNNTVTNLNGQAAVAGINIGSAANNATSVAVASNIINNLNSTGTGGSVTGIFCSNTSTGIAISNHQIHTLSSTGAATVSGITIAGSIAAGTSVFKNNIYNLSNSNATPTVSGITISAGTLTNAYNNFVSDLRAPNANAAAPIYGINVSGGTNAVIYYNTIALGKAATLTSVGAQFGVTGIGYSSSTNTTLRNNIVWIDATPVGTGAIAAVRRSAAGTAGTAPTAANFNSNNNIYHVLLAPGTPPVAANINKYLYLEGNVTTTATNGYGVDIGQADVPAQNLRSDINFNTSCGLYKTFMSGRETATFTEDNLITVGPNTFAPTGSSFAAENGLPIATPAITDDYSSVSRSATTPDIGALEFTGTGVDAAAPTISFTPLPNTICTTAPTLAAVITDASGVNTTAGLAPRLYYRKGGAVAEADVFGTYPTDNNNTFNGWKYVEATGTAPNFSFAIDYSLLTSPMAVGDSLTYFVVAQDLATTPNVGKNAVSFPPAFCPTSVVMPTTGAVPTSNSLGYRIIQIGTIQPSTTAVTAGTIDNQVLRIDIPASSCYGNITQLNFTNASTNVADISNARVYYTTAATFSTATPFGTAVVSPGATFSVNGTQASAASGINYFWLVYDIACNAPSTAGNLADASLVDAVTSIAGSLTPAVANPVGDRLINAFTPPTIATNQPTTTSIPQGTTNVQVLRVDVPGSVCIGNITQLDFTNVSTVLADITKARVYYTTTTTFSAATQFGAEVLTPGATFSVTGTQASVTTGTNYFWLVFDVNCAAVVANTVDAGCTGVVTTLSTYTPATPNPTGTRAITALTTGDNIQTATVAVLGIAGGNPYDIAGKSVQFGEPTPITNAQPTATNGAGTSNYSWGTAAGGTVWYRLDVPASGYGSSGNLLIRATTPTTTPSADAQVALWKFPNMVPGTCSDPANFTGGYLLAANDDAMLTGTGYWGASASTLNSVIRVRVNPGQTYYIQIDGWSTNLPTGDLIIEDLAVEKAVSNNGFGDIHNPTGVDVRFASYEVVGDDGWTYYYSNNGTETNVADDPVLMGLNWSTSPNYLWTGISATGNDLMNHVRRDAKSVTAPLATGPAASTSTDAFIVWSGRNNAAAASADLKPTAPYVGVSAPNWWMMNKFWNVFPNVQPTTSIGVRYFYSDADFTALQTAVVGGGGVLATAADMQMIKATKSATTHYTNAEIDPASGHSAILAGTVTTPAWTNTAGVQTSINQAQYSITTFSGGGGGSTGVPLSVLPVTLASIRGEVTGATNTVYWTTTSEQSNRKFVLERSLDGRSFTSIGEVSSKAINGNSSTPLSYNYVDANPVQGKQYYRLEMVDLGGRTTQSQIVTLRRGGGKIEIVDVRPNPTTGTVYFNVLGANANVNVAIRDLSGKEVIRKGLVQSNSFSVDMSKLANGMYLLEAVDVRTGEKAIFKVVKQ